MDRGSRGVGEGWRVGRDDESADIFVTPRIVANYFWWVENGPPRRDAELVYESRNRVVTFASSIESFLRHIFREPIIKVGSIYLFAST